METSNGWADLLMNDPDFVMDRHEQWQVYDFALGEGPRSPLEAIKNIEEVRRIAKSNPELTRALLAEMDIHDIPRFIRSLEHFESGEGLEDITPQD